MTQKRTASSYTVGSSGRESSSNLPFLIQRLDLQKVEEDANPARRVSVDGTQQRIQEELSRLQNQNTIMPTTKEEEEVEFIDWGASV